MAEGFRIADAFVSVRLDRDQLRSDIAALPADIGSDIDKAGQDAGKHLGKGISDGADGKAIGKTVAEDVDRELQPRAEKSGTDAGDKVSRGMDQALKAAAPRMATEFGTDFSNATAKQASGASPLIVAAIAGGLIAGAPALLGAAGVLFMGVAAVAVHSNAQVQAAFNSTKTTIETTFQDAAQVTVPFFVGALSRIGTAVAALGPQLHAAFASLSGPIDSMTSGLIGMANNVMPGLVAAVRSAGPVFQGLSSMLSTIGTGIGQMFQILSEHSAAAGSVFTSLGSALGALLPMLGQLMGAGAEIAANVLPPVVAILHGLEVVLNAVAPILPIVAEGFLAFKAAQMASGYLDTFAQKLAFASYSSGSFAGGAGLASKAVGGISSALPVLSVALGVVGGMWQAQNSAINGWAQALEQGGTAAASATAEIKKQESAGLALNQWWDRAKGLWNDGVAQLQGYGSALDEAQSKSREYYNSLSPLGKAQADVTRTQNDLQAAVDKWGPASGQAVGASASYKDAQQHLADVQGQLEQATHGVTQAMIDQADEALAAIDSNFALQHAQNQQRDAEISLADAIKQHGAASTQAHDASQAYIESIYRTADAAAKLAADQSGLKSGTLEYKNVLDTQLLKSLEQVRSTLSGPAADAVDGFIATLKNAGVTSDTTGQKLDDLGTKKPTPTVDLNKGPFDSKFQQAQGDMSNLAMQRPTPTANLNKNPFDINSAALSNTLSWLNNFHVFPSATLVDMASANLARIQRGLDGLQNKSITVTTYQRVVSTGPSGLGGGSYFAATGGKIGEVIGLAGKRFDVGGKLSGPGGATDDLIQAVTNTGTPLRVSNDEWVIKGASSAKYGDAKMAAINAGTAVVSVPGPSPSSRVAGGSSAGGMSVGELHVHLEGTWDFSNPSSARAIAVGVQQAMIKLEREQR